jgi:hypothetical protein
MDYTEIMDKVMEADLITSEDKKVIFTPKRTKEGTKDVQRTLYHD